MHDDLDTDETFDPEYTTHPRVVAGVTVMASIMLFWFLFAIAILVIGLFVPPDTMSGIVVREATIDDYLTPARLGVSALVSATLTALFWTTVRD